MTDLSPDTYSAAHLSGTCYAKSCAAWSAARVFGFLSPPGGNSSQILIQAHQRKHHGRTH